VIFGPNEAGAVVPANRKIPDIRTRDHRLDARALPGRHREFIPMYGVARMIPLEVEISIVFEAADSKSMCTPLPVRSYPFSTFIIVPTW
jgi:hypothetical protein